MVADSCVGGTYECCTAGRLPQDVAAGKTGSGRRSKERRSKERRSKERRSKESGVSRIL